MEGLFPVGMQIFESIHLTKQHEDWSEVRSPSRAARRRAQGHPQRIRIVSVPDPNAYMIDGSVYMHPVTAQEFRRQLELRKNDPPPPPKTLLKTESTGPAPMWRPSFTAGLSVVRHEHTWLGNISST